MLKTRKFLLFLLFLFISLPGFSQDYSLCRFGEAVSIVSPCYSCDDVNCKEFVLQGTLTFSDSLPQRVNAFELMGYAKKGGAMIRLSKTDSIGNTQQALINMKTGKILVPMNRHTIQFDFEERLMVLGVAGSYMANTDGSILFPITGEIWSGAFCQQGWYVFEGPTNSSYLFNKNDEKTETFKGLEIVQEVDSVHFLAKMPDYNYYLINSKGKKVFGDECVTQMTLIHDASDTWQSALILVSGLCYHDDDVTFILQNKKGKWFDPLKSIAKKHYIEYVLPLKVQSADPAEWFCYVAGYDNKNHKTLVALLNYKGEIVQTLHTDVIHRPYYVLWDSTFIYLLNEYSSESSMVFLADGTLLLEDGNNVRHHLDPSIEQRGYFCFSNYSLNKTYLYHTASKKLIELDGVEHHFETLEEVLAKFQ